MQQTSKVSPLTSSVSFFLFARRLENIVTAPKRTKNGPAPPTRGSHTVRYIAAPIKRVPSPFRGRGTACGGRGQYVICEAHNSKQKRIRRSAAKIEGVTAHLLSLVFLFARRLQNIVTAPKRTKNEPAPPTRGSHTIRYIPRTISISVILYPSDHAAHGPHPLCKGGNALHYGDPHLFTCYIHLYVLKFMQYPIGFL